jgi:hypothetical protein
VFLGRAKFLLHIAKGKKGVQPFYAKAKSGAQKAQTAKVEQNLIK